MTLLTVISLNERQRDETKNELMILSKLAKRHPELTVLGQFAYDVGIREKLSNKELARELHKMGYLDK